MPYVYSGQSSTPDLKVVNVGAWVMLKRFIARRGIYPVTKNVQDDIENNDAAILG
jgi:hypothetical protein